jgi:hypothetical protein
MLIMNTDSIWSVLEESFEALLDAYGGPAMMKAGAELALAPGWMTWVSAIWLCGSESISTASFMRMFPYGLARLNEDRFAAAVAQGYLIADGSAGFRPTEAGAEAVSDYVHPKSQVSTQWVAEHLPTRPSALSKSFGAIPESRAGSDPSK